MTIQETISKVIGQTMTVEKSKAEKLNYDVRTIDAYIKELRPIMAKEGLIIYPSNVDSTVATQERTNSYGDVKLWQICDVVVTYNIANKEGDSTTAVSIGRGEDTGDKAPNKAMTFAFKNMLAQVFMLNGEHDPDLEKSHDGTVVKVDHEAKEAERKAINDAKAEVGVLVAELTDVQREDLAKMKADGVVKLDTLEDILEAKAYIQINFIDELEKPF